MLTRLTEKRRPTGVASTRTVLETSAEAHVATGCFHAVDFASASSEAKPDDAGLNDDCLSETLRVDRALFGCCYLQPDRQFIRTTHGAADREPGKRAVFEQEIDVVNVGRIDAGTHQAL